VDFNAAPFFDLLSRQELQNWLSRSPIPLEYTRALAEHAAGRDRDVALLLSLDQAGGPDAPPTFECIFNASDLRAYAQTRPQDDDLTLIELDMPYTIQGSCTVMIRARDRQDAVARCLSQPAPIRKMAQIAAFSSAEIALLPGERAEPSGP